MTEEEAEERKMLLAEALLMGLTCCVVPDYRSSRFNPGENRHDHMPIGALRAHLHVKRGYP